MKRVYLLVGLALILGYLWLTNVRETMVTTPPTVASLYLDSVEFDKRITTLETQFQQMQQQASDGAQASATARLQMRQAKNS